MTAFDRTRCDACSVTPLQTQSSNLLSPSRRKMPEPLHIKRLEKLHVLPFLPWRNSMFRHTLMFLLVVAGFLSVTSQTQAQQPDNGDALPMTTSTSAAQYFPKPLTYPQQLARHEAEQRTMRMEHNRWIGFDPARPATNASYMYSGLYNFNSGNNYSIAYASRHRFYVW